MDPWGHFDDRASGAVQHTAVHLPPEPPCLPIRRGSGCNDPSSGAFSRGSARNHPSIGSNNPTIARNNPLIGCNNPFIGCNHPFRFCDNAPSLFSLFLQFCGLFCPLAAFSRHAPRCSSALLPAACRAAGETCLIQQKIELHSK